MQAPNPWIALDGVKCRGYATLQAREEDYCGCARRPLTAARCRRPPTHTLTLTPPYAQTGTRR